MAEMGRPVKYDPKYCEMIIEHFRIAPQQYQKKTEYNRDGSVKSETEIPVANQLPTFQSFADKIGVNGDTLVEWAKKYDDFSAAYAHAKELQENVWITNSMSGLYNAQFAMFFGKNCLGYKDKIEQDVTVNGGEKPLEVAQMSPEELKKALEDRLKALQGNPGEKA